MPCYTGEIHVLIIIWKKQDTELEVFWSCPTIWRDGEADLLEPRDYGTWMKTRTLEKEIWNGEQGKMKSLDKSLFRTANLDPPANLRSRQLFRTQLWKPWVLSRRCFRCPRSFFRRCHLSQCHHTPMRKLCSLRGPFWACLKINSKAQQWSGWTMQKRPFWKARRTLRDGITKERSISSKITSYVRTTCANVLGADLR